jgi:uncharacterized membrane protein YfcA
MRNIKINAVLKFWQEIVFILFIGLLLYEITEYALLGQTIDRWDVFLICLLIPLFISLIGQFFWKKRTLANALSFLLGFGSIVFIFMALYSLALTSTKITQAISMLILGIFLFFAAITMPNKSIYNLNLDKTKS